MWGLWWTKWHWDWFSPSASLSPVNSHSTDCSTIIIIHHPGLVENGKLWPTWTQFSPHPNKLKKKKEYPKIRLQ
jgi:hypothetical protein